MNYSCLSANSSFIIPTYGVNMLAKSISLKEKGMLDTYMRLSVNSSGSFVFGFTEIGTAGRAFEDSSVTL